MRRYKKFVAMTSTMGEKLKYAKLYSGDRYYFPFDSEYGCNRFIYIVRPRNRIVCFVDRFIYVIFLMTFKSLMVSKSFHRFSVFWHMFIQVVAVNLWICSWEQVGFCIQGQYKSFFYLFRYLNYLYWMRWKKQIMSQYLEIQLKESFSKLRKSKFPRRKRRFRQAI